MCNILQQLVSSSLLGNQFCLCSDSNINHGQTKKCIVIKYLHFDRLLKMTHLSRCPVDTCTDDDMTEIILKNCKAILMAVFYFYIFLITYGSTLIHATMAVCEYMWRNVWVRYAYSDRTIVTEMTAMLSVNHMTTMHITFAILTTPSHLCFTITQLCQVFNTGWLHFLD